jgi:RNA polymerase sigma-70 factor (ECF subfamily)
MLATETRRVAPALARGAAATGCDTAIVGDTQAVDDLAGPDGALLELARAGDVAAYEVLVRRYQHLALRTAHAVLGGGADVEDAVQEAFVKAYYALGRFRAGSPFRPWLLRIVANESIDRARGAARTVSLGLRPDMDDGPVDPGQPSPEATALALEQQAELLAALNTLKPDDRLVIAYRYWLDMPEAEMAAALGCARGTVKSRLSRALDRLRARIPESLTPERNPEKATSGG